MKVKSLAVLSMASASFLVGCGGGAITDDQKFLNNINDAISVKKDSIVTPADAANILKAAGYDIDKSLSKDTYNLAFDIDNKCFSIMEGDNVINKSSNYKQNNNNYHIFKVTSYYDASSTYSQYLKSDFAGTDDLFVTTGLDMGENNNIKNIQYENLYGDAKDIVINAKCDYIEFSAPKDTIYHFGSSNNVFVNDSCTSFKLHEYGESAYLNAKAGDVYLEDGSSTDVFEIPTGYSAVTHQNENATVTGAINADDVATVADIKPIEVATASEIESAINGGYYTFIRLNGDIEQTTAITALDISRSLIIDLNGRSISFSKNGGAKSITIDTDTYYYGMKLTNSTANPNVTCIIMDSQSRLYDRSGISMTDCSFIVEGSVSETENPDAQVTLCLNSGKFHAIRDQESKAFAVLVTGNSERVENRPAKKACFKMYGGYIKTEKGAGYGSISKPNFKCLQPRGTGAEIEMNYGDIESFNYCISGQGTPYSGGLIDTHGGTKITVNGGNLIGGTTEKTDECEYTPLFFPASGEVTINDAYVKGPTCLCAKRGDITINGGTFESWGNHDDGGPTSEGGSSADGSTILLECNKEYVYSDLNVTVNGVEMLSENRYIARICAWDYSVGAATPYPNLNLTFGTGNYVYHVDKNLIDTALVGLEQVKCVIGTEGTWTKQ